MGDPPVDQAPVAVGDSASVNEDGSVLIDVLANDSDPDGDALSIGSTEFSPSHGKVTIEGTQLRYTPFAFYHGPDSFTYQATDGQLGSHEATVSVTVNHVNHAPVAFNDAYPINGAAPSQPDVDHPGNGLQWISSGLLNNDVDYDQDPISVAGLQAVGGGGTVSAGPNGSFIYSVGDQYITVHSDGTMIWSMPQATYQGTTAEFQYKITDGAATSDWATVKLWDNGFLYYYHGPYAPPPPPFAAVGETYAVGNDTIAENVMANDTGATYAVVVTQPTSGHLTSFDLSGNFVFSPVDQQLDNGFTYAIISANGAQGANAQAKLATIAIRPDDTKYIPVNANDDNWDGVSARWTSTKPYIPALRDFNVDH